MGKPFPSPFAIATISGLTSQLSWAKKCPDLPTPLCTSSKISSKLYFSHRFLSPFRNEQVRGTIPPSPRIGSTRIAHVRLDIFFSTLSREKFFTGSKPGNFGPKPSSSFLLPTADIVPIVLP